MSEAELKEKPDTESKVNSNKKPSAQANDNKSEKYSFNAETAKILQLMIHSLYANKDIFLRELISNSSDALDKLRYQALSDAKLHSFNKDLAIEITFDKDNKIITITDNGIGMDHDDLVSNLGTIARSGTQEFISELEKQNNQNQNSNSDTNLIGQFGVGFYSSFMIADRVTVISRKAGQGEIYSWESSGDGEFSVNKVEDSHIQSLFNNRSGTIINLHLKDDEDKYLDYFKLQHIVTSYSDHIAFPIYLHDIKDKSDDENKESERKQINSASALWCRSKSEITDEQYQQFYHSVAHQSDNPWLIMHNNIEGKVNYRNLLFIPETRPFDLFHPDRMCRVKLYVKRVFIAEDGIDIIPAYLRFLRGVVDSEDLPLNISRETLQHNNILSKISNSIVKKLLNELSKKAKNDAESYSKFWQNFGAVLKEGLCEAHSDKEKILEVCRFYSNLSVADSANDASNNQENKSGNNDTEENNSKQMLTSLDDYIDNMKSGQKHIYYLIADNLSNAQGSLQLEGFAKKGIEVLFLTDHVDDFWVNVVPSYKDKEFLSITRADIDLSHIGDDNNDGKDNSANEADDSDNNQKQQETSEDSDKIKDIDSLLLTLKSILEGEVQDVKVTHKLADSPACIVAAEGGMDLRMERFLVEQQQIPTSSLKILEINPNSDIIIKIADKLATQGKNEEVIDIVKLICDQAKIAEGEAISNPREFSRRLNNALSYQLAS